MAVSYTTTYNLTKPEVGASEDEWGGLLNTNLDDIDNLLDGTTPVTGIDINSGTIDGAVIGGATPAAGTFTTLTANTSLGGTLSTAAQPNVTSVGTLTSLNVSGDVTFGDNDKAIFGAGNDLEIYHDGADTYITENGTGDFTIKSNGNRINLAKNPFEFMGAFNVDGSVDLYYDNVKRFETTATGIDVTGTVTADGLTVDGTSVVATFGNTTSNNYAQIKRTTSNVSTLTLGVSSNLAQITGGPALSLSTGAADGTSEVRRMLISSGGDISFYEDTGTTPKFFWDASAESLGIGTSSPSQDLEILNGVTGAGIRLAATDAAYWDIERDSTSGNLTFTDDAAGTVLTLDQINGNVGIGTSSPSQKITVGFADNGTDGISFRSSSYANLAKILVQNETSSQNGNLQFHTRSGGNVNEAMRIDSSGNVGIGVTPATTQTLTTQITNGLSLFGNNTTPYGFVSNNHVWATGTGDKYLVSGYGASYYKQYSGVHSWATAPAGTANNPITFSEAMRIDSSGNLLVGKSITSSNTAGMLIGANGRFDAIRDGGYVGYFNRLSSDGDIAIFAKDGTTVGSIGTDTGDLHIHSTTSGHVGLRFGNTRLQPTDNAGTVTDGVADLGVSNSRFKDLYLSGGVYLGGTGSANKLDDYEEGTWTPSVSTGAVSLTGTYVKVGKLVSIFLNGQVTTGGAAQISGLPFNTAGNYGFSPYVSTQDIPAGQNSIAFVTNGSALLVRAIGDNTAFTNAALTTGAYIHASFVYEAS